MAALVEAAARGARLRNCGESPILSGGDVDTSALRKRVYADRLAFIWSGYSRGPVSGPRGRAAFAALLSGGSSGFNALLGGNRSVDGKFERLQAHGFYWTASETDPGHAIFYNFGQGGQALHRQNEGEKQMAISVRCVRE